MVNRRKHFPDHIDKTTRPAEGEAECATHDVLGQLIGQLRKLKKGGDIKAPKFRSVRMGNKTKLKRVRGEGTRRAELVFVPNS